jgi:hypothetical protein
VEAQARGRGSLTSIREFLRRRFGRRDDVAERAEYSYRVFWTKTARGWAPDRRAAALAAIRELRAAEAFVPSLFRRGYRLEAVDTSAHSGASLLALQTVLEALQSDPYGDADNDG